MVASFPLSKRSTTPYAKPNSATQSQNKTALYLLFSYNTRYEEMHWIHRSTLLLSHYKYLAKKFGKSSVTMAAKVFKSKCYQAPSDVIRTLPLHRAHPFSKQRTEINLTVSISVQRHSVKIVGLHLKCILHSRNECTWRRKKSKITNLTELTILRE